MNMTLNDVTKGACSLCEANQKEKQVFTFDHPAIAGTVCGGHLEGLKKMLKPAAQPQQPASAPPARPAQAEPAKPMNGPVPVATVPR